MGRNTLDWQVNWKRWQWPWHHTVPDHIGAPHRFDFLHHYAGIGPFQFHWYSTVK